MKSYRKEYCDYFKINACTLRLFVFNIQVVLLAGNFISPIIPNNGTRLSFSVKRMFKNVIEAIILTESVAV